jgi:hypothetical protein
VPVGPAKLNPEDGSDAAIFTVGLPRSVISRSSTVSDCSPLFVFSGATTLMLARMRPCESTIWSPRPRKTGN